MRVIGLVLVTVFLIFVALLIGTQNQQVVTVNYLIAQANLTLSTIIAIALSIGVAVGIILMSVSWLSLRVKLIAARAKLEKLSKDQ